MFSKAADVQPKWSGVRSDWRIRGLSWRGSFDEVRHPGCLPLRSPIQVTRSQAKTKATPTATAGRTLDRFPL